MENYRRRSRRRTARIAASSLKGSAPISIPATGSPAVPTTRAPTRSSRTAARAVAVRFWARAAAKPLILVILFREFFANNPSLLG